MSERFEDLRKIPDQPAARLLAAGNAKLETKLTAPASASVSKVLAELEEAEAWVDMVRLLSVSLPPRESVWWACLAAHDTLGEVETTPCLKAAEAWVFEPNDANRAKIQTAVETVEADDPTALVGTAALYAPGDLGGDLKEHPAPPGAVGACVFGTNIQSLDSREDAFVQFDLIIDRALDIARGGNGSVPIPEPRERPPVEEFDDEIEEGDED